MRRALHADQISCKKGSLSPKISHFENLSFFKTITSDGSTYFKVFVHTQMAISGTGARWKEQIGKFMWMNLNESGWKSVVVREELATGIKVTIVSTIKNPHTKRSEFVLTLTN